MLGEEWFSGFYRVYGTGIDIQVSLKFDRSDFVSGQLEKKRYRGGGYSLSDSGDHSAWDEDIFCTHAIRVYSNESFLVKEYNKSVTIHTS